MLMGADSHMKGRGGKVLGGGERMANKRERQSAILEIVEARPVSTQEDLRRRLLRRGWDVTQATLSRDLRELRLARVPTPEGARYAVTDGSIEESRVALETLLPQLVLRMGGGGGRGGL